jgi:CheY-like chemotaxis protein
MARILIIEDDPQSARLVTRVLEREGYETIVATEGLTGLKIAGQGDIDLILLDLGLPDISGHTIAALINRIPGNIPVVAVTASADHASERRALTFGCDGYITKPIDTRAFPGQIGVFLKQPPASRNGGDTSSSEET